MTREEKIREARWLRSLGWSSPEIGRELGVSDSTIRNWCLGRDCVDCGTPLQGSDAAKPEQCLACLGETRRIWSAESVIAAIRDWAAIHGRPPLANDWLHVDPQGRWPNRTNVYRTINRPSSPFATWNDAIAAAGFSPVPRGKYARHGTVAIGVQGMSVLRALRANAEPVRYADLARLPEVDRNHLHYVLQSLQRRGLAVRVARGLYVATQDQRQAA